ncbi:hypothetical protein VNO77_18987 [Canavalia gladiata]|uniref:Uncharacterized protein n=1 Tax=Canavalia gladiata TaxID=3824 RepID=A0AAN9LLN2_CANGL
MVFKNYFNYLKAFCPFSWASLDEPSFHLAQKTWDVKSNIELVVMKGFRIPVGYLFNLCKHQALTPSNLAYSLPRKWQFHGAIGMQSEQSKHLTKSDLRRQENERKTRTVTCLELKLSIPSPLNEMEQDCERGSNENVEWFLPPSTVMKAPLEERLKQRMAKRSFKTLEI